MFDGTERPEQRRVVHEAIEAPQLRAQRAFHVREIGCLGLGQVERQDHGLGMTGRRDFVVKRVEPAFDPAMQHHRRSLRRAGAGQRRAEASGGAGDENHAIRERVAGFDRRGGGERHGPRDDN